MLDQHHLEQDNRGDSGTPDICTIKADFCEIIDAGKIHRMVNLTQKMVPWDKQSNTYYFQCISFGFSFTSISFISRFIILKKVSLC